MVDRSVPEEHVPGRHLPEQHSDDGRDLTPTADLLNLVFGFQPAIGSEHLDWYYRGNPEGPASVGTAHDDGHLVGNYALIPLRFHTARSSGTSRVLRLGLGVDLSTHPESRGTGAFRRTVEDSYRAGTADRLDGILGLANAQSVPRMVETLGWRCLPDFRALFLAPLPDGVDTTSHPVDADLLAGPLPDEALPRPTEPPPTGHGTRWTADLLRWRLARPSARYVLHLREDVAFVSTTSRHGPLRVAVLLKVLARRAGAVPVSARAIAAVLAGHHRTPLVLHWGATPLLRGGGIALPRRLMPSPLGIVLHAFDDHGVPRLVEDDLTLTAFEFLDFDAY